jgi:hypothetical protein
VLLRLFFAGIEVLLRLSFALVEDCPAWLG